ncbi:MAG: hypothetical protein ACRC6A_00580 [Fusobacteriaceae bacterium]
MKKAVLFFFYTSIIFGKDISYNSFQLNSSNNIVDSYNNWQNEILDLKLKQDFRKLENLKSESKLQKLELDSLLRKAEYRLLVQKEELKNDLIRAKIYYYYNKNHKKYYYYDMHYNIIYMN